MAHCSMLVLVFLLCLTVTYTESSIIDSQALINPTYYSSYSRVLHTMELREKGGNSFFRTADESNDTVRQWDCSRIYGRSDGYNKSSCRFVHDYCGSKVHLLNYLSFVACSLPNLKVRNLCY